ncbi:prepilin-type N-terminal cleavage/methylation domain-containing protein [Sporosarcina siberiensis]|uniref:Prepilin-type N-terminal cleavage/methylation domain-containing protein n=1 Tax=Sporosarcina siberiensis TaxID=1365606 RepID=A0ABW4SCR4_9BACL
MEKRTQKRRMNERGMSLVEVLAALVILGIVFVGFMIIFPQMTLFNKKTETKLETMNLARQEIALIQKRSFVGGNPLVVNDLIDYGLGTVEGSIIKVVSNKAGYTYVVEFTASPTLSNEGHPENIALHKVHLKVLIDGGKVNSETYGYIKVKKRIDS